MRTINPNYSLSHQICISFLILVILLILNLHPYNEIQQASTKPNFKPISQDSLLTENFNEVRSSSNYTYHNYSTLVSDLEQLNIQYPNLIELYTTQERFGLPDCEGGYKIWVARITNENQGLNKPEVLYLGGHHGNEQISIETPYYFIEFLLENYASNASIRYLLDHREIYVVPVLNPWGWENNKRENHNNEDPNRDYPYGIEFGNTPLTSVGASSVAELMKRHQFILSLSWHSGDYLIYYAWGTPVHDTPSDEAPDNIPFFEVAKLMSQYAGGQDKYPYGPANQMFSYAANGAWSDYAYAATWDTAPVSSGFSTSGARSLAFGIEISNTKKPEESLLGSSDEVFNPTSNIGYIPKNIRMALVMLDLAEPYLAWNNIDTQTTPITAEINSNITLSWFVNGSFSVDETEILFGPDPNPKKNYDDLSAAQTGFSHWKDQRFTETIVLPATPGDYYFVARAKVDQVSLIQASPEPNLPPQSYFVQQRTNDSWNESNNGNTIHGQQYWFSSIIHIQVINEQKNKIELLEYTQPAYCKESMNISWGITTESILNTTELYWGTDKDLINNTKTVYPGLRLGDENNYYSNFTLPTQPGVYYFAARMQLQNNQSSSLELDIYWSEVFSIEVIPKIPFDLKISLPTINYINGHQQSVVLRDISVTNPDISPEPLDDTLMLENYITIEMIDFESIAVVGTQQYIFQLDYSSSNRLWHLPWVNISTWDMGTYWVVCHFRHKYGIGDSESAIAIDIKNWFNLTHIITVNQPIVNTNQNQTKSLDITNVTAWCSKESLGELESNEVSDNSYHIYDFSSDKLIQTGELEWSTENRSWHATNISLSNLTKGKYFVICKFEITGIGYGESIHNPGDGTEFVIDEVRDDGQTNDGQDTGFTAVLLAIIMILILIFLLLLFMLSKAKKEKKIEK
jgi:hypothetical protein